MILTILTKLCVIIKSEYKIRDEIKKVMSK